MRVRARADEQEDDEEEGLEVEEGRLRRVSFARGVFAAAVDVPWWRWRFSRTVFFCGDVLKKGRDYSDMGVRCSRAVERNQKSGRLQHLVDIVTACEVDS